MAHADWIHLLARLLPLGSWKDAVLGRHLERCPRCASRLATREEARSLLVGADDLGNLDGLWPAVRDEIAAHGPRVQPPRRPRISAWRWLAAVSGLALASLTAWTAVRTLQPGAGLSGFEVSSVAAAASEPGSGCGDVRLAYVRIGSEPARTIIFKPRDADLVLIWAGRD
jgi:hypothetical protein